MSASHFLALDVGTKRIGVAVARSDSRLPRPLTTLSNDANFMQSLQHILADEEIGTVIVGLPRDMQGQETAQTALVRAFATDLETACTLPIVFQDEAVTSLAAESELKQRYARFDKAAVDALAATLILEDYLTSLPTEEISHV